MENKTQHTPGPWRMGKRAYDRAIYGQQGAEVASMLDLFHTPAESLANARLIAAAPDLLEALRDITDLAERYGVGEHCDGNILAARAAIAKAEGRAE